MTRRSRRSFSTQPVAERLGALSVALVSVIALGSACSEAKAPPAEAPPEDAGADAAFERVVQVTLDGVPVAGATVIQGGNPARWTTDDQGRAEITLDPAIAAVGEMVVMAAHPDARTAFEFDPGSGDAPIAIALKRFDRTDNIAYLFGDPGEPTRRDSTDQCAHCHGTINADWVDTAHRSAAKNPAVQDLYAGTVSAIESEAECVAAGGSWASGLEPGTRENVSRCFAGDGVISVLNPGTFGGCADCHAPGIDGKLGGRDLLEATGHAYEYGVHCDVCHRTESVDLGLAAGVAGRLRLQRPSDKPPTPGLGEWLPLMFGPRDDVPNPRMGGVERSHFHDGMICAGCHELEQPVLVPGAAIDAARWPSGSLPIHSTFSEWKSGSLSGSPCASCHMPPDPSVGNGADLYNEIEGPEGVATGWRRAPGSVRRHVWLGPRDADGAFERLAAVLFVEKTIGDNDVVAKVTVRNVGAGHAIPTGEPLRSLLLVVRARCGDELQPALGGDVIPDYGGHLEVKTKGQDWSLWPSAKVGHVVRVIERTGSFRDYAGYGRFGDGSFDAAQKGLEEERLVAVRTVTAVEPGGKVTFDQPLPSGDVAYLGEDASDGSPLAGAPGFAFARVLVGADGRRMVPHFMAVDVASDNRLLPGSEFSTEHRFAKGCAEPEIVALLVHRAYPFELARERRFPLTDSIFAEVKR